MEPSMKYEKLYQNFAQRFSLSDFTRLALQNDSRYIQFPVDPPPPYAFTHMRLRGGQAAFWSKYSCYELRNCPWREPRLHFFLKGLTLRISSIEVKQLQKSTAGRRLSNDIISRSKVEQFVKLWDSIFGKTDYRWQRNPLVWIIHFEKSPEPKILPSKTIKQENSGFLSLAA